MSPHLGDRRSAGPGLIRQPEEFLRTFLEVAHYEQIVEDLLAGRGEVPIDAEMWTSVHVVADCWNIWTAGGEKHLHPRLRATDVLASAGVAGQEAVMVDVQSDAVRNRNPISERGAASC